MFDLVPLARARWIVTDLDDHSRLIGQALQLIFPKTISMAVASATVGGDQKTLRSCVPLPAHSTPPGPDRLDGELTGVSTDSDRHRRIIGINVVNAVGNRFAEFFVREVMRIDFQRFTRGAIRLSDIGLPAQCFLLLRIDRDRRASTSLTRANTTGDVFKLGVTIRMIGAFSRLAIPLQRVSQRPKDFGDVRTPNLVALRDKFALQVAQTLAGPAQRRLRVATLSWLDETINRSN